MAERYDFTATEKKWQDNWEITKPYHAVQGGEKPPYYVLVEFPYPSGEGLHIGHPRPYTAMDIVARKRRMQGYNVLFPIGWDAFGLPTENYAIKNKIHPAKVTKRNIDRFRKQIKALGMSFDWDREVDTTDPSYYKWTQWIFLQLYKHGLAYKKEIPVNWCTKCKIVLANEEVVGGVCERCGGDVVRKVKSQWMLKITAYAQRLIDDLADLDFVERVKTQEINWIGRSEGAEVNFETTEGDTVTVFTTRPDTLFGATYMVMSPEHTLIDKWKNILKNTADVTAYQEEAGKKSDFERTELVKDKTGVRLDGVEAINPVNGEKIPIFISDYVLAGYGTGAIMAVPAHDERDWDFAKKFNLPIVEVVAGGDVQNAAYTDVDDGILINSGLINGLKVADAKKKITEWLEQKGIGKKTINYKLRDWVFSRQRYWGEPVPMVYCEKCGWVPVPEDQLPVTLPDVEAYEPTDNGESPLSKVDDWVNTTCPNCGGPGKRETDVMPNWAGSSWYFMRYCDPHCDTAPASYEALKYWMPVNWYNGGMEHVTLHLLYSRFWAKFLYDIGVSPCKEPYLKRTAHAMILAENGEKMSKSRGNVVNPDDYIKDYGTDVLRLYIMFIGDFEKDAVWSNQGVRGCKRFIDRVWGFQDILIDGSMRPEMEFDFHNCLKKVTEDTENLKFNTAIAAMMTLSNTIYEKGSITKEELKFFLSMLCPFAPHICCEMWEMFGFEGMAVNAPWPVFDPAKCVADTITVVVQINGKLRADLQIPADSDNAAMLAAAKANEKVAALLEGKQIIKEICVPGKLVNFVIK
ncbi:MAG TPA: leucine--tRNA ligase [Oscillospiraceae bacterium]|nr:leucine--tRNA ligase [Oscillospiraceae bacterium]HPF55236.1 leucine--tRNA ligase [Clostridiales bacterium]HPK35274.1 leucine--tRNA ligase [Oscillospiraceae bacterium]HPR75467.1 leucine--tRNA ligase [Oscillospiraceae bacterium]